jgi:hypothetical protein
MQYPLVLKRNSVFIPVAITAFLYGLFILLRLGFHNFNPTFFICAGDVFCATSTLRPNFLVLKNSTGYDGQFYYRLALNPFTSKQTDFGVHIDSPAYRHQRIFYPLLVSVLSFNNPGRIPINLILVNYIALCCIAWLGSTYVKSINIPALWGILFSFYPGFLLSLSRDLTEIIAACFVLATLLSLRKDKPVIATVLLSAAIFTRETAALVAISGALIYCLNIMKQRNWQKLPWYFFTVPILSFSCWEVFLFFHWGNIPLVGEVQKIRVPFTGVIRFFSTFLPPTKFAETFFLFELLFIIITLYLASISLQSSSSHMHIKTTWVLYLILMSLHKQTIWCEDWSFFRLFTECYMFSLLLALGAKTRLLLPYAVYTFLIWLRLFLLRIYFV